MRTVVFFTVAFASVTTATIDAAAQSAPANAWGIAPEARYEPSSSTAAGARPHGPLTRIEFVSLGSPQTVSQLVGVVTHGTSRNAQTENLYRDVCTTPCARDFQPGWYDLYTHGHGLVNGLHRYHVGMQPARWYLRTRPAWSGVTAGVSVALGVLATLGSIALFANATFNGGDPATAWALLGTGIAFGAAGTVLNIWAQSTGLDHAEPLAPAAR